MDAVALNMSALEDDKECALSFATSNKGLRCRISLECLSKLQKWSRVPVAKQAALQTVLCALIARRLLEERDVEPDHLSLIAVGETSHIPTAHEFAVNARENGLSLVRPVQFAHILPSACAATVANVLECHGPSFSYGARSNAVLQAFEAAVLLLESGLSETCIVVCAQSQHWHDVNPDMACEFPTTSGAIAFWLDRANLGDFVNTDLQKHVLDLPNLCNFDQAVCIWRHFNDQLVKRPNSL